MSKQQLSCFLFAAFLLISISSNAQMKRERVQSSQIIEETFWTPNLVGMSNVEQLETGTMNVTIMHNFGIATTRPLQTFFGLDAGPNVRLGIDYGITPDWSVGIGRSTFEKVVDLRSKIRLLRQHSRNGIPLSMSLKLDLGLSTVENRRPVGDDLNLLLSLPVARRFNDSISLQLSPMYSRFNTVFDTDQRKNHFAVGIGGEYRLSRRYALIAEYYLVPGERNPGTKNAFSLGLNIETGGHVFQLYLASSVWHTEQHIIARNSDNFWAGDFRFGFNVNRLFFLAKDD